jgi:hypothetical protein
MHVIMAVALLAHQLRPSQPSPNRQIRANFVFIADSRDLAQIQQPERGSGSDLRTTPTPTLCFHDWHC